MKINLMLIGAGPHAKRIYLPFIQKFKSKFDLDLKIIVDIKKQKNEIEKYLKENKVSVQDRFFVEYNTDKEYSMSQADRKSLEKLIKIHKINAIILASDPLAHKAYIDLALAKGIHVLTDKPVTLEVRASTDEEKAKKIFSDFNAFVRKYRRAEKKHPGLVISCLSQRRYHPPMIKIREELKRVYKKTNCPVTSIFCEHSDGQWRMPDEVINEKYHGFTNGVGKCSHSGYHEFDIMHWFTEVAESKKYDKVECYSSFMRPQDYIGQMNVNDYKKIFQNIDFGDKFDFTDNHFLRKTKDFGEIDAHLTFSFYRKEKKITDIQFSLLHGGFSKRSWLHPNKNLYKGNGRIRHEYISIHQGPFQAIKYESYISTDAKNTVRVCGKLGGRMHLDTFIFKNTEAFDRKSLPLEKIHYGNLKEDEPAGDLKEFQVAARAKCFKEFMMAVKGKIPKHKLQSSLETHFGSVLLMSLAYLSAAKKHNNKNPVAEFRNNKIS